MSYDLIELTLSRLGEQLPERLSPCVESHQTSGFDENVLQLSTKVRAGSGLWFAEALATFGLILTILGTQRWKVDIVPVTVGLYIASAYWFTASTSFANPAVTLARSITNTFAGIQPSHAPAFVVAQLVGALAGTLFCWFLFAQMRQA
jgi:glycerol uptake facilitator-like aquaporin